ncbi:MAG: thioredoxin family protein [Bacteroidia bacterium]|nr:thioredoxin family protein [Bacteroidia bacterium]
MRGLLVCLFSFFVLGTSFAQTEAAAKPKIYHPEADAKADIKAAIEKAGKEGKHVLLQIGGNWCVWCLRFNDKVNGNDTLKTALEKNYITYHLNYSKENKNEDVLASLGFPQRFGFPVFVVLDGKGNRLHTQSSGYLESGKGHGTEQVLDFFNQWSPAALDPKTYEKKEEVKKN